MTRSGRCRWRRPRPGCCGERGASASARAWRCRRRWPSRGHGGEPALRRLADRTPIATSLPVRSRGRGSPARAAPRACWADNDINLAALAEHRHGAGRGAGHLLVVATGHRGVGGALVVGGALYTGSTGLGMEAGTSASTRRAALPVRQPRLPHVETDALSFMDAAGRVPARDRCCAGNRILRRVAHPRCAPPRQAHRALAGWLVVRTR